MGVWDKDIIFINVVTPITGADPTAEYGVVFQPIDQTFPDGGTDGVQCSTNLARYYPMSDLDDTKHYDVYVEGMKFMRIFSPKSNPPQET
jgi:hypothetical protein